MYNDDQTTRQYKVQQKVSDIQCLFNLVIDSMSHL